MSPYTRDEDRRRTGRRNRDAGLSEDFWTRWRCVSSADVADGGADHLKQSFRSVRPEKQLISSSRLILSETFSGGIDELPDVCFLQHIGLESMSRSSAATLEFQRAFEVTVKKKSTSKTLGSPLVVGCCVPHKLLLLSVSRC